MSTDLVNAHSYQIELMLMCAGFFCRQDESGGDGAGAP
jgi:hypothetical protein